MQHRRDEILAKKAKLAELKRQREQRQKEFSTARQSIGDASEVVSPTPGRADHRRDLDAIISSLVGDSRPSSAGPGSGSATAARGSRPSSVLSAEGLSGDNSDAVGPTGVPHPLQSPLSHVSTQTLSTAPLSTVYSFAPTPVTETLTYSKGVQTSEPWSPQRDRSTDEPFNSDDDRLSSPSRTKKSSKRLSRRERERDEEIRENIRREIEDELKAVRDVGGDDSNLQYTQSQKFPARTLTNEELGAVTSSADFLDFIEKSSKVIERALDEEYDVLADYSLGGINGVDEEDEEYGTRGKGKRPLKEVTQFWDERWSKKRMISSLHFSPKFSELVLASYTKNPSAPYDPDGLVQVWNLHLHDRAEYVFHAQSDILVAKFSPFHPNLIIGGAYSGQVLLWDTRAKSAPVQKTPLTGSGHTHPVYSVDIVGTQNANNIISCSTDGVVCGWTVDMLAQPQEYLEITTPPPSKTEDLAPTCAAFPQADPTYFLTGTEEGSIYACHRYDRAGAKAGVEPRLAYRGHAAPVTAIDFHPARGPIDLGDLVLSSSLDWSVKIWKARAPAATSNMGSTTTTSSGGTPVPTPIAPLLDLSRDDVIYDAAWSPVKPGVFALVDGAGSLEAWDLTVETEVPLATAQPSVHKASGGGAGGGGASLLLPRSLNKLAWEPHDGKRIAVGGLDGVVTVFDVGNELGGADNARADEWASVKRLVARVDGGKGAGAVNGR
ncbi:MAG: hypothetical protein M1833_004384 [Piccolia ochrophora]|nr:MAG: hypothetical protein M1833_004384 [Piccolia ochrophora]